MNEFVCKVYTLKCTVYDYIFLLSDSMSILYFIVYCSSLIELKLQINFTFSGNRGS